MNMREYQIETKAANSAPRQHRGQTEDQRFGYTQAILQLQRKYGNRLVQFVLALSRKGEGEAEIDPAVELAITQARGGGRALDSGVRRQMEHAFGCDFTRVRVHTGAQSDALNKTLNAVAFTTGQDIFFRDSTYDPGSRVGRELLAHELTHVVQQGGAALQGKLILGAADDPYEREADSVAREVVAGLDDNSGPAVQRKCNCGGHAGSGNECEGCGQTRLAQARLQTASVPSLQRKCSGGAWIFEHDGCSVPSSLAGVLGIDPDNPAGGSDTQFGLKVSSSKGGRACDRHDECYQTCANPPIPGIVNPGIVFGKSVCDARFLADMLATCATSSESASVKAKCVSWAQAYFGGVSAGGGPAFAKRQAQVCSCGLVRSLGAGDGDTLDQEVASNTTDGSMNYAGPSGDNTPDQDVAASSVQTKSTAGAMEKNRWPGITSRRDYMTQRHRAACGIEKSVQRKGADDSDCPSSTPESNVDHFAADPPGQDQQTAPGDQDEETAMAKAANIAGSGLVQRYSLDGFPAAEEAMMRAAIPSAASTVSSCKGLKNTVVPAINDKTYKGGAETGVRLL
jgi:hypothetical protein